MPTTRNGLPSLVGVVHLAGHHQATGVAGVGPELGGVVQRVARRAAAGPALSGVGVGGQLDQPGSIRVPGVRGALAEQRDVGVRLIDPRHLAARCGIVDRRAGRPPDPQARALVIESAKTLLPNVLSVLSTPVTPVIWADSVTCSSEVVCQLAGGLGALVRRRAVGGQIAGRRRRRRLEADCTADVGQGSDQRADDHEDDQRRPPATHRRMVVGRRPRTGGERVDRQARPVLHRER